MELKAERVGGEERRECEVYGEEKNLQKRKCVRIVRRKGNEYGGEDACVSIQCELRVYLSLVMGTHVLFTKFNYMQNAI